MTRPSRPDRPRSDARLLHKLQVHNTELLMQNESLRQSHAELESVRDRLADLFEFAPTAYVILDPSGKILDINLKACALLGTAKKVLLGEWFQRFLDAGDADLFHLFCRRLIQFQSCELRLTKADGGVLQLQIDGVPVANRGKDGKQLWLCLTDVTERKRAELTLRQTVAFKNGILDAALDAVVVIDHEGKILEFNSAAEGMFGYPRTETIGCRMTDLIVPPGLREWHRSALARCVATGEGRLLGQRVEMIAMRRDQSEFPVELSITRIGFGSPPIFAGFFHEITQRKEVENRMGKAHGQLRALLQRLQIFRVEERDRIASEVQPVLDQVLSALHVELSYLQSSLLDMRAARGTAIASRD